MFQIYQVCVSTVLTCPKLHAQHANILCVLHALCFTVVNKIEFLALLKDKLVNNEYEQEQAVCYSGSYSLQQ